MPVTLQTLKLFCLMYWLTATCQSPKYLFAVSCDSTTELGCDKAVSALPAAKGKWNMLKNAGSAKKQILFEFFF